MRIVIPGPIILVSVITIIAGEAEKESSTATQLLSDKCDPRHIYLYAVHRYITSIAGEVAQV